MSDSAAATDLDAEGDIISRYTREQLIKDGGLVVVEERTSREAGFTIPVGITREAYARYVALTPAATRAGNDIQGRLWDVLWMCRAQVKRNVSAYKFSLHVVTKSRRPSLVTLRAKLDGDDNGNPVITILCVDES